MEGLQVRDSFLREITGEWGRTMWNLVNGLRVLSGTAFSFHYSLFVPATIYKMRSLMGWGLCKQRREPGTLPARSVSSLIILDMTWMHTGILSVGVMGHGCFFFLVSIFFTVESCLCLLIENYKKAFSHVSLLKKEDC